MNTWLVKGAMTAILAGSTAGTATFAASNDTISPTQAATNQQETSIPKPQLVQGDFFYFVKTTLENIKLALTTNNLDKAKLLSEQAAQRIAEANVLNQQGKDDLTQDTLNKAAEGLEKADELSGEDSLASETATKPEVNTTSGKPEEQKKMQEVKVNVGHNIELLAIVLNKVQNPKAKAAISKRIEESFTKLAAKIDKLEAEKNKENSQQIETNDKLQIVGETQAVPNTNNTGAQQPALSSVTTPAGSSLVQNQQAALVHPTVPAQQNNKTEVENEDNNENHNGNPKEDSKENHENHENQKKEHHNNGKH